jgi:hypothetical protein
MLLLLSAAAVLPGTLACRAWLRIPAVWLMFLAILRLHAVTQLSPGCYCCPSLLDYVFCVLPDPSTIGCLTHSKTMLKVRNKNQCTF